MEGAFEHPQYLITVANRTADEALADDQKVLGFEYGTAFHHCKQELWRVSSNWDRYEALFGLKARVDVLNASSGSFWHAIQGVLFEHVVLGICRLTDPSSSFGRRNLTVKTLGELDTSKHNARLHSRIQKAVEATDFARTWRNARIAHNDYDQLTGQSNRLDIATRRKVTRAIIAIHSVLRWVQGRHFDGDLFLHELGDSGAESVLYILNDGIECRKLRREQWRETGIYNTPYDFDHAHLRGNGQSTRRYDEQGTLRQPSFRKR